MEIIPQKYFDAAGELKPYDFEFYYDPKDPAYGVGITIKGTIPQLASVKEAARVGGALQMAIFGIAAECKTVMYPG